jgi:hypothetical protein
MLSIFGKHNIHTSPKSLLKTSEKILVSKPGEGQHKRKYFFSDPRGKERPRSRGKHLVLPVHWTLPVVLGLGAACPLAHTRSI